MKPLILICSQDPDFFLLFSHILEGQGFASVLMRADASPVRFVAEQRPQAVLLDCQARAGGEFEICTDLKCDPATERIPVIALIAPGAEAKHIALLSAGVDEAFVRPFAPQRLLDHLVAIAKPVGEEVNSGRVLKHGGIELNQRTYRVFFEGREIDLPPIEYRMMAHLLGRPAEIFSREELAEIGWPDDGPTDLRSVDVHIARLRKAFKRGTDKDVIRTERSAGYGLADLNGDPRRGGMS